MIEDLIRYYQRELAFLRDASGAFSAAHPKIAGRLGMTRETIEDPHVERLIEGVALINARLRHKLDDEFPELSDTLLEMLYPHLIQPLPSFFVARLQPSPHLDKAVVVPRGTLLLTEEVDGVQLKFQLAADTTLLPVRIASAMMAGPPLPAPDLFRGRTDGVLHIEIATTSPETDFTKIGLDSLRLYLRADSRKAQILVEQLGVDLIGVGVACGADDPHAVPLPPTAVRIGGFDSEQALLPQKNAASATYAVLQEYFAYPEKHLFVEISGLAARTLRGTGDRLDLFFYFDRISSDLERLVDADDFELFAAPAINLFAMAAEPILLDQTALENRIVPDARREDALEVHSLTELTIHDSAGTRHAVPPLYTIDRATVRPGQLFRSVARRSSFGPGGGDDLFLAIADPEGSVIGDTGAVALPSIFAMNRELPSRLPYGGGHPALSLETPVNGLEAVAALTKPTPTRRPPRRKRIAWKLISQLSLNYLSLTGDRRGAAALRELLSLYDVADSADSIRLRERLVGIESKRDVARIRFSRHTAFCSGTAVTLELDDERLSGSGSYLLCEALHHFLASAATINTFVRLSARLRREDGLWKTWRPKFGDNELV
jgi:type VI secretion system protein ImpG